MTRINLDLTQLVTAEDHAANADRSLRDGINAERQRRILAGTTVEGVRVTGTDNDTRNLMGLALGAQLRLAGGDNETITTFRDADNVDHELTPEQVLNLWQKSTAFVSMLYQKSWEIKALEPIPPTYAAEKYWS